MDKRMIMLGMFLGSTVGGYIPVLFGASAFSFSSIIFGAIGGILGIWVSFKLLQ